MCRGQRLIIPLEFQKAASWKTSSGGQLQLQFKKEELMPGIQDEQPWNHKALERSTLERGWGMGGGGFRGCSLQFDLADEPLFSICLLSFSFLFACFQIVYGELCMGNLARFHSAAPFCLPSCTVTMFIWTKLYIQKCLGNDSMCACIKKNFFDVLLDQVAELQSCKLKFQTLSKYLVIWNMGQNQKGADWDKALHPSWA